jgi:large subunit ribosomal protein L32
MAVPKQKRSKGRQGKARLHIFIEKPTLTKCPKCGHFILPHIACPFCGYYKGKEVIDVLGKLTKKERKKREKEMKLKEKEKAKVKKEKPLSWKELSKK